MKLQLPMTPTDAPEQLVKLQALLSTERLGRTIGTAVVRLVQTHLNSLPTNKQGWPSTGFWQLAARGTSWDISGDGVVISIDNERAPGAVHQRFYGGTINAKDKKLTIPARAEFYGHRAGEFDNLKLIVFKSTGTAALVIGQGGTGRVNFATGRSRNVSGAGVRSEAMVAYWLKDSVDQDADPSVIPDDQHITDTAVEAIAESLEALR